MNNFDTKYKNGILSKKLFLEATITKEFTNWILPFINGESKSLSDFHYEYTSFQVAIQKYSWGKGDNKESFIETLNRFNNYRQKFNSADDNEIKELCLEILAWGGVLAGNKIKIDNRTSIKSFILNIYDNINKDEIIIKGNKGISKIFSTLLGAS